MAPVKFRGCPRCHGDIFLDKDDYGWYQKCLQCGFESELGSLEEFGLKPQTKEHASVEKPRKAKK